MLRMRLEAEGVPAFVQHEFHIGNNWPWSTALGGVKVQVWHRLANDATEIARLCRLGGFRDELANLFGDIDDPRCPFCGSFDYRRRRPYPEIIFVLAVSFLFVLTPASHWIYFCRQCGTKYRF